MLVRVRGWLRVTLVLWFVATGVAACNEGRNNMRPPVATTSSPWNGLTIPGVELFLDKEKSQPYRQWGAAKVKGSRELHGKAAFDAVRAESGADPTVLATLAMLFLDDGVAGRTPWTAPEPNNPVPEQAIAKPPALSGDTLTYWRLHTQMANLVRIKIAVSTGQVTYEDGGKLFQAERVAKDGVGAAKQDLASSNIEDRLRGISTLGQAGGDAARTQLIDIALNAEQPRERTAAVTALAKLGGADTVAAVSRVLLYDQFTDVREAAAETLGALADPAGKDALERASTGDADIRVRQLSKEALKRLKK